MRRTAVELEAAEPRLGGRRRHERVGRGESLLGGQRVEFLGELLAVGVDFVLLSFLGMRERLVELLLPARLADHDERSLAVGEILAELLKELPLRFSRHSRRRALIIRRPIMSLIDVATQMINVANTYV